MRIRVLFFGALKDLVGAGNTALELPENATVANVLEHYGTRIPGWQPFAASIAVSVNQEYAGRELKLHAGDEVAMLPPVSGGSNPPGSILARRARLVREAIDTQAVQQEIKHAEDGAVVVFEGIVRNHSRGRRTLYLDYEAYEEMALRQMESLAEEALANFAVRGLAIVHRLGRLEIGETSVLIVVAAAHRAAAFDACRWLIDTLKRTVPIWKKEYFHDGAVWADGEPFPAGFASGSGSPAGEPASK